MPDSEGDTNILDGDDVPSKSITVEVNRGHVSPEVIIFTGKTSVGARRCIGARNGSNIGTDTGPSSALSELDKVKFVQLLLKVKAEETSMSSSSLSTIQDKV